MAKLALLIYNYTMLQRQRYGESREVLVRYEFLDKLHVHAGLLPKNKTGGGFMAMTALTLGRGWDGVL